MRPADEEVRSLAGEILMRPEYARWRDLDVDILMAIERWIIEYLRWVNDLRIESPILYWLYLAFLLGVAAALIAHIVWALRTALRAPAPAKVEGKATAPPDWAAEAERFAAQGRFLDASHHLLLGSVEVLVGRGVIDLARADANSVLRERVRSARLPDPLRARFLDLLDAFERRWFRDRTEDDALFRAWRELHAQLASAARGPA